MTRRDFEPLVRGGGDELTRDVLGSARADAPSAGARQRMLATLAAEAASPAPALGWSKLGGRYLGGIGLAVTIGAAALMASFRGTSSEPSVPSALVAAPPASGGAAAAVLAPHVPSIVSTDAAEPAPAALAPATAGAAPSTTATARPAPPKPAAGAASRPMKPAADAADEPVDDSTLGREVVRMKAARAALAVGDAARTLQLLDQYDVEFPSGAFALEVSVLRIEALARSGRSDDARRLADRFLAEHPQGAFARRVTATLRSIE